MTRAEMEMFQSGLSNSPLTKIPSGAQSEVVFAHEMGGELEKLQTF